MNHIAVAEPYPVPATVADCLKIVKSMRDEAYEQSRYTGLEYERRILWGMYDALNELARRIERGEANPFWARWLPVRG